VPKIATKWLRINEKRLKSSKITKKISFLRYTLFNDFLSPEKTEKEPLRIEPDLAGERKAHFESDTTMLLAAMSCYLLLYIALLLVAASCR